MINRPEAGVHHRQTACYCLVRNQIATAYHSGVAPLVDPMLRPFSHSRHRLRQSTRIANVQDVIESASAGSVSLERLISGVT